MATPDLAQHQQPTPKVFPVDVCGKRTLDYVIECLSKFNAGTDDNIALRAIGGSISKGVGVAQILVNEFGFSIQSTRIHGLEVCGTESSCLEIELRNSARNHPAVSHYEPDSEFVSFPVYHLLLDALLFHSKEIRIFLPENKRNGGGPSPLISIKKTPSAFRCVLTAKETSQDFGVLDGLATAYYRCGLVLSPDWEKVARALASYDDILLGIDTNILFNAAISEQIINSLFLIDIREYVHTPNWVLIVIPNAVVHEVEQWANTRNDSGFLAKKGRIGFRALQEILELNRSADLTGISVTVVGVANPVLDTRVELRGLREDFSRLPGQTSEGASPRGEERHRLTNTSSGDMMIRAQFKEFLRQIDFHKGVFFLTADKGNAAMARAEGLHAIYYKTPHADVARSNREPQTIPCKSSSGPIRLDVPIGKLLYELAVQFQSIRIEWGEHQSIRLQCDGKGESLDHWLMRELRVERSDLRKLTEIYGRVGRIELAQVSTVWNRIMEQLLGNEVV